MSIEIESGVPIPSVSNGGGAWADAMRAMAVGDSFTFPSGMVANMHTRSRRLGIKVTMRAAGNGEHRVWRLA